MLLRKPFVNRRRKKKSGLAVDRAEMAHQCSAQAPENQFHNDSLRHAQTIKSDRLLASASVVLYRSALTARGGDATFVESFGDPMHNAACPQLRKFVTPIRYPA